MNLDSLRSGRPLPRDRAVVDALPAGYETDATVPCSGAKASACPEMPRFI